MRRCSLRSVTSLYCSGSIDAYLQAKQLLQTVHAAARQLISPVTPHVVADKKHLA